MSAFLVSNRHIDAIVTAARLAYAGDDANGTHVAPFTERLTDHDLGRLLWRENALSVAHRYREGVDEALMSSYAFSRFTAEAGVTKLDVVGMMKTIQCYEYQACDHPGWEHSQAKRFCRDLKEALISCLPGYGDAPWGIA